MQRVRAAFSCWLLDLERAREAREERNALARAGEALCAGAEPPEAAGAELSAAWQDARGLLAWRRALGARLEASLAADRRDFQAAPSALGCGLAIARGLCERLRLRDEVWRARACMRARLETLGKLALGDPGGAASVPDGERKEIERARAAVRRVDEERARLLAPHGGQALPRWLRGVRDELMLFLRSVGDEVRRKLLLRLPALAAMAAAWWLTRCYTTSALEAAWHDLTGQGRAGLSRATMERLSFWLPLLAAALAAYLTSTFARRVRRRYGRSGADAGGTNRIQRAIERGDS